ncbi:hypothetical protein NMS_1960 [Nonlabens marinus S1-08]|uniref:Uncharacterized protein n=1 Tax=Nonlabens marinus S1-08 TaxID=1454201 RepID=W8VQY3_9FLAO|nr:hypothetical protein NMS_1960 [Nonlabens marinus S1-08]
MRSISSVPRTPLTSYAYQKIFGISSSFDDATILLGGDTYI